MNTDFPRNVLVVLSVKNGAVVHASCDPCKASELKRCSHVCSNFTFTSRSWAVPFNVHTPLWMRSPEISPLRKKG